jgi:hypothetical protein
MLPGEAAEEDRHLVPLLGGEGPLRGTVVMAGLAMQGGNLDQPLPLRGDARSRPFFRSKSHARHVAFNSHRMKNLSIAECIHLHRSCADSHLLALLV